MATKGMMFGVGFKDVFMSRLQELSHHRVKDGMTFDFLTDVAILNGREGIWGRRLGMSCM